MLRDFPTRMGIPDVRRVSQQSAYVKKQEEKSYRGLLKLFNRACDATGRPRYEELQRQLRPPPPLGTLGISEGGDIVATAHVSNSSTAPDHEASEIVPEVVRPPPGLDCGLRALSPEGASLKIEPKLPAAKCIQAAWRGYRSRPAAAAQKLERLQTAATSKGGHHSSAKRLQRWWRSVRKRWYRIDLRPAAARGVTAKACCIQAAWRRHRRRRAEALLGFVGVGFMPTPKAKVLFCESFLLPAQQEMQREAVAGVALAQLGACWAATRQRLEVLGITESLEVPEDCTLATELEEAVRQSLRSLWRSNGWPLNDEWVASWRAIGEAYDCKVSAVLSTANALRSWFMRVHGCTVEDADVLTAQAVAEAIRRRRMAGSSDAVSD